LQYVKVATGQSGVMQLGGNLPESLARHAQLGYEEEEIPERPSATEEQEEQNLKVGS